jgi:site-specific DNA recombinase
MLKAAIYARYSSDNQREESIDAQIRAIKSYAENNNYTIVKTYIDEALSGKTDHRPQFLQMISDAKMNMFDAVICHKLDRFARNRYDSAFYKKILKENNIKLISVLENFDDSPESIILESVLEGMAEYYSANLAREVMKGLRENALQCKHTGGKPPFGYDVNANKNYTLNKHEASAINQIFSMIVSGQTVGEIIKWLTVNGYTTKYGTKFTAGSINAIIRNEKYKGVYVYGKSKRISVDGVLKDVDGDDIVRIEDGIPRIVTNDIWAKANSIYDNRRYKSGGQAKAKEIYLLSGLIFCGACGGAMCGNKVRSGRNKSLRITYRCNTRKAKKNCNAKDIRKDLVEGIVINEVDKMLSNEGINDLVEYLYEKIKEISNQIPDEITDLQKQLTDIEKQIEPLVGAIIDGLYSPTVKQKLSDMEIQKQDIIDRIDYLENCSCLAKIPSKDYINSIISKDKDIKNKSPEEQKRIIRAYVKKVIVYPDHLDIISEVDTKTGAEGNRTPVRKPIHCSFSHYSQSFTRANTHCSLHETPTDKLPISVAS